MTEDAYKEIILELNRNPMNKKSLVDFDKEARELNPVCGDEFSVRIKYGADDCVSDIGFQGSGCAISQAAASVITDAVKGKTKKEILAMGVKDIERILCVSIIPTRVQCALLCLKAIQKAL